MSGLISCGGPVTLARETDQFTTPRAPLADIGPELSRKVVEIIESDRTGEDPERILAKWVGRNVLVSHFVLWMRNIRGAEYAVSFRPNVFHSIYRRALPPLPASFLFDAPTVRVHGYYMGTDKLDHFFQQGHGYYQLARKQEAAGASPAAAIAAVVARGVEQEHKFYGTLATGVYSNGDLAANYAGMKFYQNLRHPIRIGDREMPALFERTSEGFWRLSPGINPDSVLEPFLSNHLDESLNPSRYYRLSRKAIRSAVRSGCNTWVQFYGERVGLVAPSGQSFASKWFGEEYGHWLPPADEISIATECSAVVAARSSKRSLEGMFE